MDYYKRFLNASAEKTLREYRTKNDDYWRKVGETTALGLFKRTAVHVPAYKKFLQKNKINPASVRTIEDFKKVPVTDKENYINKYKLNELCWNGKVANSYFLSASSGSTGIPNYWPRGTEQTFQGASISELIYKEYFECDKKSTLYIVAFAMGMWIAGTYMMMSTEWVAQKGYPITIAAPGLNREEIVRLIKAGGPYYDQVVLVGYPPFVKDIVDFGTEQGVDWEKTRMRFLFSGEAFTERWRAYLARKTGLGDPLVDTINIYGSADVGLVAHETKLTNFVRKLAANDQSAAKVLFGAERVPSVNQFNPHNRYFECIDEELVISAPSGLPLVRYNTKDIGGVMYFEDLGKKLAMCSVKLPKENAIWKIPIVYLFGRGKFSATIYGITVFPEYVKYILDNERLTNLLTGKYVISTEESASCEQKLHLRIELKENIDSSQVVIDQVKEVFIKELPKLSSEYKHLLGSMGGRVHPEIHLHTYGDPEYFPRGVIKKNA